MSRGAVARTSSPAPRAFRSQAAFRGWLESNHAKAGEIVVRLFKKHAAARGLTYAEALDEALCWGWIDGVRRTLDADSFAVRFTPRTKGSVWSRVNVARVQRLVALDRMAPPGLAAFAARDPERTGLYSFEREHARLTPSETRRFRAKRRAWADFEARPPGYRKTVLHWVTSPKRADTRERRLAILIDCSARGVKIPPMGGPKG